MSANPTTRTERPAPSRAAGRRRRATMTVTEAAEVLGVSRSTAYELVRSGDLPALRLGRRIVVPEHAIDDLLDSARRSA